MRSFEREMKMRIAMLGHKRVPSREGGVEIVVEELSVRMVQMGHQVTLYNRRGKHVSGSKFDAPIYKTYKGIRLKTVPTIDIKGIAAMSSSFFAAIRAAFGKYDVVHFHAEGPCAIMWLPKLFGKKCVATIHGLDHQRAKWGKFAKAYIMLGEKCAARFADEIIVLSENVKKYFLDTYNRKTTYIPNGVSRPTLYPADEITNKFGLTKDNYILFLGRIVPEKGIHYLIEAFKNVETTKKLVIAGGSSDSKEYFNTLKESAKSDPRILFTDFVAGRTLEELYSNAYLYVLPSDLEGMPLSLLEAMSYGNCCIVSDIPECTEVVEDQAVTFQQGNAEALKESIQTFINDEEKVKAYKIRAAEFILKKYSWDEIAEKTEELYNMQ